MNKTKLLKFSAIAFTILFLCNCSVREVPPQRPPEPPPSSGKLKPYKIGKNWYYPIPHARGFSQEGKASWYGKKFHGRKTANGEIYDMYKMTAAHKTLPLGTYVKILNKTNNKEIIVRVNDRGPFVRGRIIDLSFSGAKKLGIVGPGTAPVKLWALGKINHNAKKSEPNSLIPVDYYKGNFVIQIGAFKDIENAKRLIQSLAKKYRNAHYITYMNDGEMFYRVRVGKCGTLMQAEELEKTMTAKGFHSAFIVSE